MPYIGRFAPSPTGPLHFGSLVAAVASYADARKHGGRWLLRIEDIDQTRCSAAAETEILGQLAAYGFVSDEEVIRQSARTAHYAAAIALLRKQELIFSCVCTRKTLENAPRNGEGEPVYPGTCRNAAYFGDALSLRLRADSDQTTHHTKISFVDRAYGLTSQCVAQDVGDFVLQRADGWATYQLAVVVDDAAQGVTDVVRGADLLMNTPRQIYLQRCLGVATPRYLHVPLARNANGEKLSKQTLAAPIRADNALQTLQAAWSFLGQPDVTDATSVAGFWRLAFRSWDPEALQRILRRA
jgi:glutamyl-Q tRNA(Asp) synthetase